MSDDNRFKTPHEKLLEKAEEVRKRKEMEVVECEKCGTEVLKDSLEEAIDTAEDHIEKRHDGERVATVNGIVPPSDETAEKVKETIEEITEDG